MKELLATTLSADAALITVKLLLGAVVVKEFAFEAVVLPEGLVTVYAPTLHILNCEAEFAAHLLD